MNMIMFLGFLIRKFAPVYKQRRHMELKGLVLFWKTGYHTFSYCISRLKAHLRFCVCLFVCFFSVNVFCKQILLKKKR